MIKIEESSAITSFSVDQEDKVRIDEITTCLTTMSMKEIIKRLFGNDSLSESFQQHISQWKLAHGALLIFPESIEGGLEALRNSGYSIGPVVPSVVVKKRLAKRYRIDDDSLNVHITHGTTLAEDQGTREIEVFMVTPPIDATIIDQERSAEHEAHFAFRINNPTSATLIDTINLFSSSGTFRPDGGGFNPNEEPEKGGVTVIYFTKTNSGANESKQDKLFRRIEIQCTGDYWHTLERVDL